MSAVTSVTCVSGGIPLRAAAATLRNYETILNEDLIITHACRLLFRLLPLQPRNQLPQIGHPVLLRDMSRTDEFRRDIPQNTELPLRRIDRTDLLGLGLQ